MAAVRARQYYGNTWLCTALTEWALHKRELDHLLHALIVRQCGVWHIISQLVGVIAGSVNVCRIAEIIRE